jgi:hypothetical protein
VSSRPERSEVEGPAVLTAAIWCSVEAPPYPLSSRAKPRDLQFSGPVMEMFSDPSTEVSSRLSRPAVGPERTRISRYAAPDEAAYAPFRKEGRMNCNNAIKSNRKSGIAKWRDLLYSQPLAGAEWKCHLPLCHPACPGLPWERSRGICNSANVSWKCFPTHQKRYRSIPGFLPRCIRRGRVCGLP